MGHRLFLLLSLALLLLAAGHARAAATTTQEDETGVGSMMRTMVGSRPPSCTGRCWWCGARRCEAVQVPVTPQQDELQMNNDKKRGHGRGGGSRSSRGGGASSPSPALQVSSYDDHSNYKPLSWRCKCGDVILDP